MLPHETLVHFKDFKLNCEIYEFIKYGDINTDYLNENYLKHALTSLPTTYYLSVT
jgi:hypothetical protein